MSVKRIIVGNSDYEEQVIKLLKNASRLPTLSWIAKQLNLNYITTRALLLEMMLAEKVVGRKTTSGCWVFYPKRKWSSSTTATNC